MTEKTTLNLLSYPTAEIARFRKKGREGGRQREERKGGREGRAKGKEEGREGATGNLKESVHDTLTFPSPGKPLCKQRCSNWIAFPKSRRKGEGWSG
jgi:hypothetical protein